MRKLPQPPTIPFSVRFTHEERERLLVHAGHQPLGTFIREAALSRAGSFAARKPIKRVPSEANRPLAQALLALGREGLATNIATLARSAQSGLLIINPETELQIAEACADIHEVRHQVMAYLRLLKGAP